MSTVVIKNFHIGLPLKLQTALQNLQLNYGVIPMVVGGFVRDAVLEQLLGFEEAESKDIDIEMFNVATFEELVTLLKKHFDNVVPNGQMFNVVTVTDDAFGSVDFSLPRIEESTGDGTRDFIVESNTSITMKEAALRRDFTFNALMWNPLTHELFDFFNGIRDLKEGILKPVSDKFKEDPLRVLRGMQFASRFNLMPHVSFEIMGFEMIDKFHTLSQDRIRVEWLKWASGEFPHRGLEALKCTGWLEHFPELDALIGVQQNHEWHPEGDAWNHTIETLKAVVEAMRVMNIKDEESRIRIVFGMLGHDFGKPDTTVFKDGSWRSPKHDVAGIEPARSFGNRLFKTADQKNNAVITKVMMDASQFHMRLADENVSRKAVRRVINEMRELTFRELIVIMMADKAGRPWTGTFKHWAHFDKLMRMSALVGGLDVKPKPTIGGKHIKQLRPELKPGKIFGIIVRAAHQAELDEEFFSEFEGMAWLKNNIDDIIKNAKL